eukprot:gene1988-12028_t
MSQKPEDNQVVHLNPEVGGEWARLIPGLEENPWCPLPVPPPAHLSQHRTVWITDASEKGYCCLEVDLQTSTTTEYSYPW